MILTREQLKDDQIIKDIFNCANEVYGQGIAIPSSNHPCGWDWLDFSCTDDILTDIFYPYNVSNGIYEFHKVEDKTLKEILEITEGKFLFEINTCLDWEDK